MYLRVNNFKSVGGCMDSNIKMKVMKNASVIQKENGFGRLLKFDCSDGLGLMTVYNVFPGIELIYNEFETTEFSWKNNTSGNVMEINHCREGREGSQLKNGAYLYLGEGDLSIHMMENCAPVMSFPLKHYRGISVVIDLDIISENPPDSLKDTEIDFIGFKEKFCGKDTSFIMPAKDEIEHIFSELYRVPEGIQMAYFKLKIQELLLFLCMVDVRSENQRAQYMPPQVEVVKKIHKKLIANLKERPTIEELSKEYLINTSTLKETFKGIYGMPIASYMKTYRIKQADNAIEGALKCVSRRYIHIKIIYRKENLFIKISNSFDGKVKKDRHGHLISMKSDLTRYGLGLALIEKSVNKYNGLLNFDIDEENFTLTVLLYS